MAIQERIDKLIKEFAELDNWENRYKVIIDKGRNLPLMEEKFKKEENLVKGCQSQVWLHGDIKEGKIRLYADSDAAITKGIVALLLFIYSGATPDQIISTRPDFIETIGLKEYLSSNRTNGLAAMIKQIIFYALAFKAKSEMS